jgi:hypothetical protein
MNTKVSYMKGKGIAIYKKKLAKVKSKTSKK